MDKSNDVLVPAEVASELLRIEDRSYKVSVLIISFAYLLSSILLSSFRAKAPVVLVWVLVLLQLFFFFAIFVKCYQRAFLLGLNRSIGFFIFVTLAVLARINDWEIVVIPVTVLTMLTLSWRNKKLPKNPDSAVKK